MAHPAPPLASSARSQPSRPLAIALLLGIGALWAALPAAAQPWTGPAGMGVEVEDASGSPLSGAEVTLVLEAGGTSGGPEAVRTDSRGRAELRGLAEGTWRVLVVHPSTLAYVAQVEVRQGRRPRAEDERKVKVNDSLESLEVSYFEVSGPPPARTPPPSPPPQRPAPQQPEPRQPEPQQPAPAPPAEEPAQEPSEQEPAREAVPAPAEPAPATPPATPPETPPEITPEPAPPRTPEPAEPSAEPAPPPPASPSNPQRLPDPRPPRAVDPSEPPPSGSAPPEPQMAPGPPTLPPIQTLRSFSDRTCPECQPGEWATTVQAPAAVRGAAAASCELDLPARAAELASLLTALESPTVSRWAGPLASPGNGQDWAPVLLPEILQALKGDGDAERGLVRALTGADPSCPLLAVWIPASGRFVGFRAEVTTTAGNAPAASPGRGALCIPGRPCPDDASRFLTEPALERTPAGTLVLMAYQNGSTTEVRVPRVTAYFTRPGR